MSDILNAPPAAEPEASERTSPLAHRDGDARARTQEHAARARDGAVARLGTERCRQAARHQTDDADGPHQEARSAQTVLAAERRSRQSVRLSRACGGLLNSGIPYVKSAECRGTGQRRPIPRLNACRLSRRNSPKLSRPWSGTGRSSSDSRARTPQHLADLTENELPAGFAVRFRRSFRPR